MTVHVPMHVCTVAIPCRGSPEESKGDEASPVLMLRNLKEEVRKEDVSGGTP